MKVKHLNADNIDGYEYFLRLSQIPEDSPFKRIISFLPAGIVVRDNKLYFTIREIRHEATLTLLFIKGSWITFVLDHEWEVEVE